MFSPQNHGYFLVEWPLLPICQIVWGWGIISMQGIRVVMNMWLRSSSNLWVVIYKAAYSLRQTLTPIPNTATSNIVTILQFTLLCFSQCTCIIVTLQKFLAREQCMIKIVIYFFYIVAPMNGIFVCETENNALELNFHNFVHNVSPTIFLLDYKAFKFAWCVLKNKPLLSHYPRKDRQCSVEHKLQ